MVRGFDAVAKALALETDEQPPGKLLILVGKTLVATVGGASGPLWGTAFRRAGRGLGQAPSRSTRPSWCTRSTRRSPGSSTSAPPQPEDKTMIDALVPATDAMRSVVDDGGSLDAAVAAAATAAEEGARATVPMQARKGRASYLGERSIGHQDPGATSAALIMRALERAVTRTS